MTPQPGELVSTADAARLFDLPEGALTVWMDGGALDSARRVVGRHVWWDVAELRRRIAVLDTARREAGG